MERIGGYEQMCVEVCCKLNAFRILLGLETSVILNAYLRLLYSV